MSTDRMRTIVSLEVVSGDMLRLRWSDGSENLLEALQLGSGIDFTGVELDEWGHSIELANGEEIGADRLWLEALSASGRSDARSFLEWRLRNGLSLSRAADALGLARRTVAYYSNGDRPIPKAILLACKGWDASHPKRKAA